MENTFSSSKIDQKFNLKKTIGLYTKHWFWFVLSVLIFISLTYLYLRYTIPQYQASSEVLIIEDSDEGTNEIFNELSLSSGAEDASMEDEILVFKSRKVLKNVVEGLNLNVQYFTQGVVLENEIYNRTPFEVNLMFSDSLTTDVNFNCFVNIISETSFQYRVYEDDEPSTKEFGTPIETYFGNIVILPDADETKTYLNRDIRLQIGRVADVVEDLRGKINVTGGQEGSRILTLSLVDPIEQKAKDILNTLIEEYDAHTSEIKNRKSEGTSRLIDDRISRVFSDLENVDASIARFKIGNKVTDVGSQAGQYMTQSFQNEQQIENIRTQLKLLNYTKDRLSSSSGSFQSVPSNLGDGTISALSGQYNALLSQRENKLKSAGAKNSIVQQLDQSISNVKNNLSQNINATTRTLNIQLNSLQNQYQKVNSKISSVPGQENKLKSIERSQGIKESIYLYLLQKKEEAIISQTVTSSNVKVIDPAYSYGQVSPKGSILYMGALFLGFLIPFGFIYAKDLLDTKIHNREDLHKEIDNMSILGEVPRIAKSDKHLVERNDRSILSESFRIIRTNFDFVSRGRNVDKYNNIIFVTSTINGEGKSFFSMNMALTLASTNKKVLLIGADIRNPQIFSAIRSIEDKVTAQAGLTDYIADKSINLNSIISEHTINDIKVDILFSGKIPPNPAELLMSDRLEELFDTVAADYDYVMVDTAPSMLVTDTLLISKYAGHTFYVTRAGYTEKEILNFTKEIHADNKLNGMMLVVNDVDQSNFGYGARYGYYGAPEKKGWFSRKKA
ncbi:GumC family protein [Algibacter lectus]|uniref:GumC family protein n=1 Tax=Algibacter lectus TaxID=221126 RepID=UPI0024957021|nr:polysaccharide biosynthesis tyrosine autokinase [Algibacter lectus]